MCIKSCLKARCDRTSDFATVQHQACCSFCVKTGSSKESQKHIACRCTLAAGSVRHDNKVQHQHMLLDPLFELSNRASPSSPFPRHPKGIVTPCQRSLWALQHLQPLDQARCGAAIETHTAHPHTQQHHTWPTGLLHTNPHKHQTYHPCAPKPNTQSNSKKRPEIENNTHLFVFPVSQPAKVPPHPLRRPHSFPSPVPATATATAASSTKAAGNFGVIPGFWILHRRRTTQGAPTAGSPGSAATAAATVWIRDRLWGAPTGPWGWSCKQFTHTRYWHPFDERSLRRM